MTQFVWSQVRADAVRQFDGETPRAELEQEVINAFERSPVRVIEEIKRVATAPGEIRSRWAVLRSRLATASVSGEIVVTDTSERDRRVAWAERWVRTAGLHFERRSEVADELFGELGRLRQWAQVVWLENDLGRRTGEYTIAGDELLSTRLLALWELERPKGQLVEAEMERVAAERVLLAKTLLAQERARVLSMQETQEAEVGV